MFFQKKKWRETLSNKSKIIFIKNKDKITTFLVMSFFFLKYLATVSFVWQSVINTYITFCISIIAAIIAIKKNKKIFKFEIIFYSSLIILMTLSYLYNRNIDFTYILLYFQYIFITVALIRICLWKSCVFFYLLIIFIFYSWKIMLGYLPDDIMISTLSRNNISIYILLFCALYYISFNKKNKGNYIIALVGFVICLWSGSRSGIFSSIILLVGVVITEIERLKKLKEGIKKIKYLLMQLAAIICIVVIVHFVINNSNFLESVFYMFRIKNSSNAFGEGIIYDIRFMIIRDYLNSVLCNMKNFFWGAPYKSIDLIQWLQGNPHNMYISLHSHFGLVGFVLIVFYSIFSLLFFLKANRLYFFVFLSVLVRGFSDNAGFFGIYDPIVFYFIFYAIITYKNKKECLKL